MNAAPLIDSHCHIWQIGKAGCTWPGPELAEIYCDFTLADLEAVTRPAGVSACVVVQSQEDPRDTAWLLDQAAANPFVVAVVGWTDLLAPDASAQIAAMAASPSKLRGLRPMVQDQRDDWFNDARLAPAAEAMIAAGLTMDALVRPGHLRSLHDFAKRFPALPVVIDHAAKPGPGQPQSWRKDMARLAQLPQVTCKMSGLLTETPVPREAIRTALEVLELFGPARTMWGSDWPVVNLAGDYADWLALAKTAVPAADQPSVFGGSAAAFYGLVRA